MCHTCKIGISRFSQNFTPPMTCHSRFLHTYKHITRLFLWLGIKRDIKLFVASCDVCQRKNYEAMRPPGLLQPLPIPQGVWQDIALDFIEGLPKSVGKNVVLVVVDRLTKYGHFVPLTHPFTVAKISDILIKEIFRLHGMPKTIVSDHDTVFISNFWDSFFTTQGTQLCHISSYHPVMVRLKFLIIRWNITYVVSSTTNPPLGSIGSLGLSGGTTPRFKLPSK